jgi:hypothetical protein
VNYLVRDPPRQHLGIRIVTKCFLNPLSMKGLEGEFKPDDKIKVSTMSDALVFERKQ